MSRTDPVATERFLDLCIIFDRMTAPELAPLAVGLGLAARVGEDVSSDLLMAVGTALYAKGVRPAELDRPFQEALHAATGSSPPSGGENPASSIQRTV